MVPDHPHQTQCWGFLGQGMCIGLVLVSSPLQWTPGTMPFITPLEYSHPVGLRLCIVGSKLGFLRMGLPLEIYQSPRVSRIIHQPHPPPLSLPILLISRIFLAF